MKRWLTIIVLILTAAVALADGDVHSSSTRVALPTAVLSQDNSDASTVATPLLATPTGIPIQICGAASFTAKGSRHTDESSWSATHNHPIETNVATPKAGTSIYPAQQTYVRIAGRYIYFLQRIII